MCSISESKWSLKEDMKYRGEIGKQLSENEKCQMESAVSKRGVHGTWWRTKEWSCWAPRSTQVGRWGLRSVYLNGGVLWEEEVHMICTKGELCKDVLTWIEENHLKWSCTEGAQFEVAHHCAIDEASSFDYTIDNPERAKLPPYSSWKKIILTFCPVAYSDSTEWIAAATSSEVCGVRGRLIWNVARYCHMWLLVQVSWWYIKFKTWIISKPWFLIIHDYWKLIICELKLSLPAQKCYYRVQA